MGKNFMKYFPIIVGVIIVIVWLPMQQTQQPQYKPPNTEVRAAIDIGSGDTNLQVAKVDAKSNKIISKIYEETIQVPYQKELEQSSNNTFNHEIMNKGISAIQKLKQDANKHGVKKIVAVATAAFRQADNAQQFAKDIEKDTGVHVRIINQDEEGILAFRGALAVTNYNPENVVVWDIGGGSMQLTALTPQGTYHIEKGKTASIPFKNMIIEKVEQKDIKQVQTPNPISSADMQKSLQYASQYANESSQFIKSKISDHSTVVIAVGNLFNKGVKPMVNNPVVKEEQLKTAVLALAGKTDAELNKGALSEVSVSNPLLVLGYMQALNINQIHIVNVNNADGALTNPTYWQ